MKTLIVVAHPKLEDSSTQAFLQAGSALVPDATWHPLPATVDVVAERRALLAAERIVLQFPLLWYQAPAALAGWLSAVWSVKFARRLADKQLGVVVSLGRPVRDYQPGAAVGVTVSALLTPFQALAQTAGMHYLPALVVEQFARMPEPARQRLLVDYQQYLSLADGHFNTRADWWQHQLDRRPEAAALAEALAARQARLVGLQQALKEADDA